METCQKCQRRKVISYRIAPEEAFRTVVLNRWRIICASCFDIEAEKAGVRYKPAPAQSLQAEAVKHSGELG
jgi:hypothetical protein